MSINVNVSGNPISIKRGKLITADFDSTSDEFQKRRKIRLEQVRQQSKDIAEKVRNKVRDQKYKQLSDIEKEGEKELRKWQNQKLLSLHQQYRECLKDIGLGHAQAVLEEESDVECERQNKDYKETAKNRGEEAVKKLNNRKYNQTCEKAAEVQKKQLNRNIENTRARMVTNLNKKGKSPIKKKKRAKLTTDINISRRLSKGSESEVDLQIEDPILNISDTSSSSGNMRDLPLSPVLAVQTPEEEINELPALVSPVKPKHPEKTFDYYSSTQISDRIKNRQLLKSVEPRYTHECDVNLPSKCKCCCFCEQQNLPPKTNGTTTNLDNTQNSNGDSKQNLEQDTQLPTKPTIALKPVQSTSATSSSNKVQYPKSHQYKDYQPTFERISEESVIEIHPSARSEAEYVQRMHKRDEEAQQRGKRALEKEKVNRNYKEMLQQLPALQKQERIASIATSKPTFHMSNERLKAHEKKQQNHMENAYERIFPKRNVITIPPRHLPANDFPLPFQTISVTDTNPTIIDLGTWDFDKEYNPKPHIDSKCSTGLLREMIDRLEDSDAENVVGKRQKQLEEMWQTLKEKRTQLAKQIDDLPDDSRLRRMLSEVGGLEQYLKKDSGSKEGVLNVEKNKSGSSKGTISSSSSKRLNSRAEKPRLVEEKEKKTSPHCLSTDNSTSSSKEETLEVKVKKRSKSRKSSTLVLQNTSTQTTPAKQSPVKDLEEPVASEPVATIQQPIHTNLDSTSGPEKNICQIVIKIDDDGKPQVCVDPSKLKDKEIIVKTGVTQTAPLKKTEEHKASKDVSEIDVIKTFKQPQPVKPKVKHKSVDKSNRDNSKSNVSADDKIQTSWMEYFSQNSSTNTSTSYYSPPDIAPLGKKQPYSDNASHHLAGILKDKPQQHNIHNTINSSSNSSKGKHKKNVEVCPLKCIQKLLTMSRKSVEDLQVSSVSDVSTPGPSIMQTSSNVPKSTGVDYRSEETLRCRQVNNLSPKEFSTPTDVQEVSKQISLDEYCETNYPNIMSIYNKLAENCSRKIEYLSSLLEQNRLEKLNLISQSSSSSDPESSTKYLALPSECKSFAIHGQKCTTKSSSSSGEQEELNQQLLEIDYKLVERLKSMTPEQINKQFPLGNLSISESSAEDTSDRVLVQRFRDLVSNVSTPKTVNVALVPPLLIDMPDIPPLEVKSLNYSSQKTFLSKPPLSKGLTVARRFNSNINSTPHQLSTIAEIPSRTFKSQTSEISLSNPLNQTQAGTQAVPLTGPAKAHHKSSGSTSSSSNNSLPDLLAELMLEVQKNSTKGTEKPSSSTESSDNNSGTVEAMLESLGMGSWALATLRKTQESLAIPSSSSSVDSTKHKVTDFASLSSETLLKTFNESQPSSSQFIRDFQTISSADKTVRRTSTPVHSSSDKSKGELENSDKKI